MSKSKKTAPAADLCMQCGGHQRRTRENYFMPLVGGAWGVTLADAEIIHCDTCGQRGISIQGMGPLMRGIAAAVVHKQGRLAAPEVTFLRKHIDYTGARLAKTLGVTGPSVSRWETGKEPIGPVADRLLRLLVIVADHAAERFDPSDFEAIEDGAAPMRLTLRRDQQGNWRAAAA